MYYAKKVNEEILRCNLADEAPGLVEPSEEQLIPFGVIVVHDAKTLPDHDPATHGLAEIQPVLDADGKYYAQYVVIEKAPEPEMPKLPGISE